VVTRSRLTGLASPHAEIKSEAGLVLGALRAPSGEGMFPVRRACRVVRVSPAAPGRIGPAPLGFSGNMIERQISRNGRISRGESTVPTCRHAGKPRDPAPTYPQAVLRTSRQLIMPDRANAVAGSAKSRVSRALQEPSRQGSSRQELPMRPPGPAPPAASRLIACKQMNESCSDHGCRAGRKEAVSDVPLGQVRPRL